MPNPAARNANRVAKRVSARLAEEFIRCPIVEWRKQGDEGALVNRRTLHRQEGAGSAGHRNALSVA